MWRECNLPTQLIYTSVFHVFSLKPAQRWKCLSSSSLMKTSADWWRKGSLHYLPTDASDPKASSLAQLLTSLATALNSPSEGIENFRPPEGTDAETSFAAARLMAPDVQPLDRPAEGVLQFRLSNGIRVNARRTFNEPKSAMLRVIAAGQHMLFCSQEYCLVALPAASGTQNGQTQL